MSRAALLAAGGRYKLRHGLIEPSWTVGVVSGSFPLNDIPRAAARGVSVIRMEFDYTDTVSTLKPYFDAAASAGIRIQPLAGWNNGINVPDLSNLVTWAAAFGPGGTNWGAAGTPYPLTAIELGNENSAFYKSGDPTSTTYINIAKSYGTRALALQNALAAGGAAAAQVGTLLEMDDGNMGSNAWIANAVSTGGSAMLANMKAPVLHTYGPDTLSRINRVAGYLATAGSTKQYCITETGIASDNGVSLTDNYGWPVNLTYSTAATDLTTSITGMRDSGKVRQVLIYNMTDNAASGSTTDREGFFGLLRSDGTAKGGYTTAGQALVASTGL